MVTLFYSVLLLVLFCRLMQSIVVAVYTNDLEGSLKRLANERQKFHSQTDQKLFGNTHSIYRDILFLACKAVGRANIDLNEFDKVYSSAYHRIVERNSDLYKPQDKPLTVSALYCRQYFRPLSLP